MVRGGVLILAGLLCGGCSLFTVRPTTVQVAPPDPVVIAWQQSITTRVNEQQAQIEALKRQYETLETTVGNLIIETLIAHPPTAQKGE